MTQLMALRDVFRRTGALHELQKINLHAWAGLVAPHLLFQQVEVKPDNWEVIFDYTPNKRVLRLFTMRQPKNFAERLLGLNDAIQLMFGDEFKVLVRCEGATIFSGDRKAPPTAKPTFEGIDFEAGRLVPSTPWVFRK
jgi:hypothetical protein